jgi:hypothetical protein
MTLAALDRSRLEQALLQDLPALLTEVQQRLSEQWPDYASFLDEDSEGVIEAASMFVHRLLDMSVNGLPRPGGIPRDPGDQAVLRIFEQIGRRQQQVGNDVTRLLTAFQLGARIAWRHVSSTGLRLSLPPESLTTLADSVFVFVNQLSFAAVQGYVREQVDDAVARERSREELADLLLSDRASTQAVRVAAARAGWRIPGTATVVHVAGDLESVRTALARLESGALPVRRSGMIGAIVPEPSRPGRRLQLSRELRGAEAVVGMTVSLRDLPRSVEVARIAAQLRASGVLEGDPLFADEHLDAVIVWRDESLLESLRRDVLAPLEGQTEGARKRLTETLAAWLYHLGDRQAIAQELHVHPQTVRYRLSQLRELFGGQLDDPRSRARLFLALVWQRR